VTHAQLSLQLTKLLTYLAHACQLLLLLVLLLLLLQPVTV
jgi:hypothetical protein